MVHAAATPIVKNIVAFGRLLRQLGMPVTPERTRLFLQVAARIGVESRDRLKFAGRAVYTGSPEDREVFDAAFDLYWRRSQVEGLPSRSLPRITQRPATQGQFDMGALAEENSAEVDIEIMSPVGASSSERLRNTDFQDLTAAELNEAARMIARIEAKLPRKRSRRRVVGRRGRRFAVRASLRRALSTGGELLEYRWSRRVKRPRQIVIVADVSGSMERYTRLLLRFAHAMEHAGAPVEVFVFATRLTRITRELRHSHADAALTNVAGKVFDFSGGTRIGESLREFNRRWVRRVMRSGAIVLLISDGWERGDPDLLSREMAVLSRSCYRLLWLSPLAGQPGFSPDTLGLRAALPWVDEFLPCGNVRSLETLAGRLSDGWNAGRRMPGPGYA